MIKTPEVIDFLGIKVPATDFSPRPMVKTYYPRKLQSHEPPDMFYTPVQEATNLFILIKGTVLTYQQTAAGFIFPVELIVRPTVFGEEAFRRSLVCYSNFATPLGESTVTIIDRRLKQKLYSYPGLRDRLEDELIARKASQGEMQAALATKSIQARLAWILMLLSRGEQNGEAQAVRLSFTHQQLASAIGSTRESVTANLGKLAEMKLVSLNGRGWLTLADSGLDQLSDLAVQEKF